MACQECEHMRVIGVDGWVSRFQTARVGYQLTVPRFSWLLVYIYMHIFRADQPYQWLLYNSAKFIFLPWDPSYYSFY